MATYYIDGSVPGTAGVINGSGTQLDPWTQNSGVDLLEAARQAIKAGAGVGTYGDTVVVLDGDLSLTTPITYDSGWDGTKPFVVRPDAMDGTQRIDFDMGLQKMFSSHAVQKGTNFYYADFHGFGDTTTAGSYIFNWSSFGGFYFCSFDSSDAPSGGTTGLLNVPGHTHIIGNRFLNENVASGLLMNGSSGNCIRGNYFEINSSNYRISTYGSEFANNVFRVTAGSNLGIVLPIHGGMFRNNTFYGVDASTPANGGSAFYISGGYEHNTIINNYFENMRRTTYAPGTNQHGIGIYAGNYNYNIFDINLGFPDADNTTFLDNNVTLTSSGLVDPANGDYRPNDSLIGQGFNPASYALDGVNPGVQTVGAIEATTSTVTRHPLIHR